MQSYYEKCKFQFVVVLDCNYEHILNEIVWYFVDSVQPFKRDRYNKIIQLIQLVCNCSN